ncbi:hypothetical protein QQ045_031790 [Rhodiola kirilowii]
MADPVGLVVAPILSKVIDAALRLITEEIVLISGLDGEIKNLSRVLARIKNVLYDAEEKQISSAGLKFWLKDLRDAAYDAEDVLDLFATKAHLWKREKKVSKLKFTSHVGDITKTWFKRKAAQTIKQLFERFKRIDQEREQYNLQVLITGIERNRVEDRPETGYFVDKSEVVGRQTEKETIINALITESSNTCDHFEVISIIGIGGAGKTTLAQLIFNDARINQHFHIYKMWVCVNVNFDLTRILREMIRYHSKMKNYDLNLSRGQLESRLEAFLANNRFLLVLDDVWTENADHWNSLKGLLKLGAPGSRVLVTSRNTNVANTMSTGQEPHRLCDLTDEESWQLFSKFAFINGRIPQGIEEIGRKIMCKCNGLPLAIKAMAGLLRGNIDVNKWNNILRNEIWELEEQNSMVNNLKVLPALKLSFDHLPSHLKQCFLFCSIFPKAHSFDKSELVKIWIAEGFIPLRSRDTLEDTGSSYFDELLGRSFFLFSDVSRDETYRMHDFIHDLALSISAPDYFQVTGETSCETGENSRHVSLLCENVVKPTSHLITKSRKVRTILMRGGNLGDFGKILDDLFHSLKYIRVLDLSSSSLDALPNSIQELQLLRYLDLSKTEIKMLPDSICNLLNLQTLRLLRCLWLHELPKDLAKLTSLRHLELDDIFWYKLSRFPAGAGSLKNLHNLQKFWVGPDKGYGVDELQDLMSLTGTLHLLMLENVVNAKDVALGEKKNLRKVVFQWSKEDDGVPIDEECLESTLNDLQPHSEVEELQIIQFSGSRFPAWITDGLLQNLTSVSLNHCINCKILSIGQLPRLTWLYLKGMPKLEEWPGAQWPSLKLLKISDCPKLRVLPDFFFELSVLKIKKCDSLKVLPVTPSLMFLTLIDNAVLEHWNEVAFMIIFHNGENRQQDSLCNLLDVKIIRCPMLKQLPEFFTPRKLEISECEQLRDLPPLQNPAILQHLALDTSNDGTLLTVIPADSSSLASLVVSNISTILSLPKMPSLPGIKALYIRGCIDLEHLCEGEDNLQSLTSLTFLSIQNCPKLRDLPSSGLPATLEYLSIGSCPSLENLGPNDMLKAITSLKDLYIQNCQSLKYLPDDGFPDSLRHLRIQGCPLISERCRTENGDGPDWPKICDIPDLEIDFAEKASASDSGRNAQTRATSSSTSTSWFKKIRCKDDGDACSSTIVADRTHAGGSSVN